MAHTFAPHLATPLENHNKTEVAKRTSDGLRGDLHDEFRDDQPDITWETEQLAKSYGIYLEFNRAKSGKEKDWMYMIRIGIPGGGPVLPHQWAVLDQLADEFGRNPEGYGSIRLTTRAAVQFHWVPKPGVIPIIKRCAEVGLLSLNGCGDNVRNVLACPLSIHSPFFDGNALAVEIARYFQLPTAPFLQIFAIDPNAPEEQESEGRDRFRYGPQLLNRKFKIAIGALFRDPETGAVLPENCVELRTHDMGILPLYEDGAVSRFQVYVGGGQGEKYGKATASLLALPLAIATREELMPLLDAIVSVHQEWGDREHRHSARLKYVIKAMGIDWFRARVAEHLGTSLTPPDLDLDVGPRHLHHGWIDLPGGDLAFGAFIENGRLMDNSPNGRLKTMVRELATAYQTPIHITPNQDLVFTNISREEKDNFSRDLASFGHGQRNGKAYSNLRMRSGACVGRDTCRLAYTDSEKLEPELIDQLEALGWGHLAESIGITGCERQCFRPGTKTIGLVGSGMNRYQIKLMGGEDGREQGVPLNKDGVFYLRAVPREQLASLISVIFRHYEVNREPGEDVGTFHRRVGMSALIQMLEDHPETTALMQKTTAYDAATVINHQPRVLQEAGS